MFEKFEMKSNVLSSPSQPIAAEDEARAISAWLPEAAGNDPARLLSLAAGPSRRLGELVADAKPSRPSLVAEALEEARISGRKIGEALVDRGVITPAERDTMLEFQRHQRREAPTEDRLRLGRILVSQGHITDSQLKEALERQRQTGRPLGEELVAQERITKEVLQLALGMQRRLVVGALVAALTMVNPGAVTPAEAARSATQSLDFKITIPRIMRLQVLRQIENLEITQQDVARGYVEVASGSLLEVTANTQWDVSFAPNGGIARSARVRSFANDIVVGPEGGVLARLRPMSRATMFDLSYRFDLAPGVSPGTYPWPLTVSAHAA